MKGVYVYGMNLVIVNKESWNIFLPFGSTQNASLKRQLTIKWIENKLHLITFRRSRTGGCFQSVETFRLLMRTLLPYGGKKMYLNPFGVSVFLRWKCCHAISPFLNFDLSECVDLLEAVEGIEEEVWASRFP